MKKRSLIWLLSSFVFLAGSMGITAEGVSETIPDTKIISETQTVQEQDIPDNLSVEEYKGLLLMREEEKLAMDVYLTLGEMWDARIFFNIARSEEKHMDAMLTLLNTYGIPDPIQDETVGVFSDPYLQTLYDALVAQGSRSYTDALMVGAEIEDLDIKDLLDLLSETDKEDITRTYDNLLRGSENHIRAFDRQLSKAGETYSAKYIDDTQLAAIIGQK